ncbi:MAG: DUF3365 domain-containing protein [Nitrospirae bacterium]|nr:DUF3365 domain-containing protein [Nitrospirota bacterium]
MPSFLNVRPFQSWRVRTKLVALTVPFVAVVTVLAAWGIHLRDRVILEEKLVQRARSLSTQIMADRQYYTSVVIPRAIELGGSVGEDYRHVPGRFPLPATFVREVSDITAMVGEGYTASLISPWPINKRKGATDQFQQEAFAYLLENPNEVYYRTDSISGRAVMRFLTTDRASVQACADCHNAHPGSPRHDFALHDVMGGLEIVIPMDRYLKEERRGFLMILMWGGGIGLFLISVVGWGARQAIIQPLAKLTERLQRTLRAERGRSSPAGPAGSANEMARFEQAYLDLQTLLDKQQKQIQLAAAPTEQRIETHLAALFDAQEHLHLVIDHAKHAIFYLDRTGVIRWANRRAMSLTTRLIPDLIGRNFLTLLTPESAALAEARLAAARRGEQVPSVAEFEAVLPSGGSRRIEATVATVQEAGEMVGRLLVAYELIPPVSSAPE